MKAFTDIVQSEKLAEFLPLESADMYYYTANGDLYKTPNVIESKDDLDVDENSIPCWSLVALLGVVPYLSLHKTFSGWRCDSYNKEGTSCILGVPADNPVDACYEMILKLHELNLL